jgi:hypothetical protein
VISEDDDGFDIGVDLPSPWGCLAAIAATIVAWLIVFTAVVYALRWL